MFFCLFGYFQKQQLRGILKKNLFTRSRILTEIYKLLHSKRLVSSVYSKSLKSFTERNFSKDLTLRRQTLADVCKIDVLKDFAKFIGKHLHQILYLMKLPVSSCSFIAKENLAKMSSCELCRIFKNTFFMELFWVTTSGSWST